MLTVTWVYARARRGARAVTPEILGWFCCLSEMTSYVNDDEQVVLRICEKTVAHMAIALRRSRLRSEPCVLGGRKSREPQRRHFRVDACMHSLSIYAAKGIGACRA